MQLNVVRRIRDSLYGSIALSSIENKVVAHRAFQRLRRVKQTAFLNLVFPGANHTRFEHSLGVMHQAYLAWSKLLENQTRIIASLPLQDMDARAEDELYTTKEFLTQVLHSERALQALRLAALLHDVGHPPYSHSGEAFLPTMPQILEALPEVPNYLVEYLTAFAERQQKPGPIRHEIMSLLVSHLLLSEVCQEEQQEYLVRDTLSILLPEISPDKDSPLAFKKSHTLCHSLLSGDIDIDRMDYLIRDSRALGVSYGIFDLHRVLDSLVVYHNKEKARFYLAVKYSGLAAFEDYLRARQSMYAQVYFHKTSVAAEAMLMRTRRLLEGWSLPASAEEYIVLDDYNIDTHLREASASRPAEVQKEVASLMEGLRNRRLWKRIYETTAAWVDAAQEEGDLRVIENTLSQRQVVYEKVTSKVNLTSFTPFTKGAGQELKLLKKDHHSELSLVPIEDHSPFIAHPHTVMFERIYISPQKYDREETKHLLEKALKTN